MNIYLTLIFSLISAAALIFIYSMRVKRSPEKVSALFLWQGLRHASIDQPLFRKFFREKLFYLHAAILLLLFTALIQSGLAKPSNAGQKLIFIFDVSASMKALENGESRLGLAKKTALSILENYEGVEAMIITAGKPARKILPFESGKGKIRNAINKIEAEDTAADIEEALLISKPYIKESDRIYLISDGAGEDLSPVINETPNLFFIPIGETVENAGIQTFEIFHHDNDAYMSIGVSLKNFGSADIRSTVDLLYDDKVIDAQHVKLPAGTEETMIFNHVPAVTGSITARLNHPDALLSDNYRYAVLSASSYPSVLLVTNENFFLLRFLKNLENYDLTVLTPEAYEKGILSDYDIGIYDNYVPSTEMSRDSIYINPGKDIYGILWENDFFTPEDIYSLRKHPVMHYTDFSDLTIQKARKVRAFEGLALLDSSLSPLIIISSLKGKDRAILSFDIKDSNFPKSVNFPIFFTNLLNWLQSDNNIRKHSINCGETFLYRPSGRSISGKATIKYPDGMERNIGIEKKLIKFSDTSIAGIYSIMHNGGEIKLAVNIPPAESDIRPAEYAPPSEETAEIKDASSISYSGTWKILGILAILLLLSETKIRERLT